MSTVLKYIIVSTLFIYIKRSAPFFAVFRVLLGKNPQQYQWRYPNLATLSVQRDYTVRNTNSIYINICCTQIYTFSNTSGS